MSETEKIALKMAVTGFICCIGLSIYIGIAITRIVLWNLFHITLDDYFSIDVFWMIFDIGKSIFVAANPYALFVFSSAVRKRFAEMYFCCFAKKVALDQEQQKSDDSVAGNVQLRYLP
jgi:hypothetical protein